MRLLGSTKKHFDQDKNVEDVPEVESTEVVLVHCNPLNSNYQEASKVLFTLSNKQFGQLIDISSHSLTMLDTANIEFSSIKVKFTDKNNEPLEIKDNVNNYWADIIKTRCSTESRYRKYVKGYDFLSFARKCGEKYDKMLMDSATKQE